MKIKLMSKLNPKIEENQINITVEYAKEKKEVAKILDYIKLYKNDVLVKKDNKVFKIYCSDIILFYSKNKENYCKTKDNEYKIKNTLYELEKISVDFIRISKKYIINVNHIKSFNVKEVGIITINLDNGEELKVSRRKIKDIIDYFDERSI